MDLRLSTPGAARAVALGLLVAATPTLPVGALDALPSWREGPAKRAILSYVERVSRPGSPDYVPAAERIATFDNDGTLWPENPLPFQMFYALDTLRERVKQEPALREDPMVQAALGGDLARLLEGPRHEGLLRVLALTHAGMTTEEFRTSVQRWLATARHPRYGRPYDQLAYQPMLELLRHLRAKGFSTFIVSGGGADFMRVWSERVYGIPPEQVVGSTALTRFELRQGQPVLVKSSDHLFVDDKAGKPVGIHAFIGRRPIAAFGNSDGDLQMLQFTTMANPRPSFGLLVHHTDPRREYAYDAHPTSSGKLVEALRQAPERGWVVVDMAKDWAVLFPQP
ncbi:HAD family phosphatase [Synechococcus sp. RedBA-s]|uniref:HAD family hydrolase n=1 Tax=Synechococcus sp. RedBA-s TaxID=2823741 RepID=UPI0020CCE00B|nr:HAD family hydrolase [Synechococcus sp. RedBA-s]MCP9800186.1 haloacid dehalogenase-like hydrolase [Synechococcus sp. RedBA-s]